MTHLRLLQEGKISPEEYDMLDRYKREKPGLYQALEKRYGQRAPGHIQRAERQQ